MMWLTSLCTPKWVLGLHKPMSMVNMGWLKTNHDKVVIVQLIMFQTPDTNLWETDVSSQANSLNSTHFQCSRNLAPGGCCLLPSSLWWGAWPCYSIVIWDMIILTIMTLSCLDLNHQTFNIIFSLTSSYNSLIPVASTVYTIASCHDTL